jgi:hypothetical protein
MVIVLEKYQNDSALADTWAKPLESVWLIRTGQSSSYWWEKLSPHIDTSDGIAIFPLSSDWLTYGIDRRVQDWMNQNMR